MQLASRSTRVQGGRGGRRLRGVVVGATVMLMPLAMVPATSDAFTGNILDSVFGHANPPPPPPVIIVQPAYDAVMQPVWGPLVYPAYMAVSPAVIGPAQVVECAVGLPPDANQYYVCPQTKRQAKATAKKRRAKAVRRAQR